MQQNFTINDLVKYIYKETSATESYAIKEALRVDTVLFDNFQDLMSGYIHLPKVTFAPTNVALQNILDYSAQGLVEAH